VRIKSNWQLANEAEALIGIASERAKERQRGGQGGSLLSQPVDQANGNGKATEEVGKQLGVSEQRIEFPPPPSIEVGKEGI